MGFPTTVQALGQSLAAGSSLNISLPILAPTETNNTTTDFDAGFNNNGTVLPVINALVPASITGTSYSAKFVSNTPLLTLANNQAGIAIFNYQNTGNQPWYDDNSISSSTWRDSLPTHLATANPINRSSGFDYNCLIRLDRLQHSQQFTTQMGYFGFKPAYSSARSNCKFRFFDVTRKLGGHRGI